MNTAPVQLSLFAMAALASFWMIRGLIRSRGDQGEKKNKDDAKGEGNQGGFQEIRKDSGAFGLVGNTPLIYIESLSKATKCNILAKVEFVNPGGSVKDRVAKQIILEAESNDELKPGSTIYEGTAGSTGISLALLANSRGYKCHIFMPDDQALEKSELLKTLGATVERVRPVSYSNPEHFCNLARRAAEREKGNAIFANQFDNLANFRAHYEQTGPEIWEQTKGKIDALVSAAGTGGTIAGISKYLKEKNPNIMVFLIDPPGSALYNKVNTGVLFSASDREGKRKKHQVDTITEGIGINNRLTKNFLEAKIDLAFRGTDKQAVEMAHYLLREEGLFVGSSSAMNCVGAVMAAKELGPGHTIVTILCDSGQRHLTKFWSQQYLANVNLLPTCTDLSFMGL